VGSLMYFQRSLVVAASIKDSNERTAFFAQVYSLSALAVIALQLLATGRLLSLLGISFALSCFPISCAALIGGIANFPSTSSLAAAEVTRKILGYVLVRPAREVLFTAVSREEKYHCKILIDSVLQRLGDSLAAGMFEILDVRLRLGQEGVAVAGVMMCLVWLIGSISLGTSFRWLTAPAASLQSLTQEGDLSLFPLQSNLSSVVTTPATFSLAVGTSSPSKRDREAHS
jgi:AAA family ATP:ADP antiporter